VALCVLAGLIPVLLFEAFKAVSVWQRLVIEAGK
jgi:hypothetical protein